MRQTYVIFYYDNVSFSASSKIEYPHARRQKYITTRHPVACDDVPTEGLVSLEGYALSAVSMTLGRSLALVLHVMMM